MFYHLSNSVGSGKTQAVLTHIRDNMDHCYLYVAPTVKLCEELYARLLELLVDNQKVIERNQIQRIVHDDLLDPVFPRAKAACEYVSALKSGVVIVTEVTFRHLLQELDDAQKAKFSVFIDEGLPPVRSVSFNPENQEEYLQYFTQDGEGFISAKEGHAETIRLAAYSPKKLAEKQLDQLAVPAFREICELVASGNYDVYLTTTAKSIMVVGLLSPRQMEPFKSITLVVAIFEQTLLPILWKQRYGIEIRPLDIGVELYDTHAEKGPSIKISYLLHKHDTASKLNLLRNFKTGKENEYNQKERVIFAAAKAIDAHYPEGQYCWAANNDFSNPDGILSGRRMPTISAGIDEFRRYDVVVSLVCINPLPWVKNALLEIFHLDDDRLYELWRLSHTYQTVGRCSLRVRDGNRPIHMIVISRRCAEQLADLFKGAEIVGQLTDLPSYRGMRKARVKKFAYTAADNSAYSKYRKREIKRDNPPLEKDVWYEEIRRVNLIK